MPYVRNYFKNERLYPRLADRLSEVIEREGVELVHGQHVLTSLPSIEAAHRHDIPAVCTVRDYWPVCYWSDLIYSNKSASLCPECSAGMMTRCIRPRGGALWPLALPMIPYMQLNLARKRTGLARADAIVAVSSTIAADLRARAPEIATTRLEIIPNPVDVIGPAGKCRRDRATADRSRTRSISGSSHRTRAHRTSWTSSSRRDLDWPLVIVGDGPDRAQIEAQARQSREDIRFVGWIDRPATVAWLAHASMLIFTSRGPESLSRVLLEASALGVPIAAMNTGGTPDIVTHGETGLLSATRVRPGR